MQIKRFGLSILFVLVTAAPSWSQKPSGTVTEISTNIKQINVSENRWSISETKNTNLTLDQALGLALTHNPALAAFDENIRAKDAAALQAGLRPNPELTIEMENFAGEDELAGFDGTETTIALSQLIELGGKRSKRRQIANLEKDLADWDYQSQKLDILAATANSFIQTLAAQQRQMQTEELVLLAEQTLSAVSARVEAGKVSPLEQVRARVELSSARTKAASARRALLVARRHLAANWDAERADFRQAVGDLTAIEPLTAEATLRDQLHNNPDLARGEKEIERLELSLSLARSQVVPDLTLSLGVRNFQDTGNNALVAGMGLSLPLFDRNQGGIREANANNNRVLRERRAREIEINSRFIEAWQNLAAAHDEATALRDDILPGARSAFEAAEFGYREGKFDFLQLLDAQRTLFEIKDQYLQVLAAYQQARTEVDRLIGSPLHKLPLPATAPQQEKR